MQLRIGFFTNIKIPIHKFISTFVKKFGMLRVIIIVLCVVLDIWLLQQIWISEKNLRTTNEKLFWTLMILLFHVVTVAIYIFLDTNGKDNDKPTNLE